MTTGRWPAGVERLLLPSCASRAPCTKECRSHWPGSQCQAGKEPRAAVSHGPVTAGTAPTTRERPRQATALAASVLPRGHAAHRGPKITDAAKHVPGSAPIPSTGLVRVNWQR